jgi:hypothetical protein
MRSDEQVGLKLTFTENTESKLSQENETNKQTVGRRILNPVFSFFVKLIMPYRLQGF